ncbi:MAG: hypothetical protein GX885_02750 [Methanomicrobiales archaeon]|nr:hypothetical protein [Methanomicrobiales archaeon]
MTVDNADEVMAEYLLKGGKMLAKSCKICGYPLFEFRGETQCVICPLEASGEHPPGPEPTPPAPEVPEPPAPTPAIPRLPAEPPAPAVAGSQYRVIVELEETVVALCERIRREQRADECLTLMMAVERGVEALAVLGHW